MTGDGNPARAGDSRHPSPVTRHAFTLVEVLVVMVLMLLIVFALMQVFNSTQTVFRASVTQAGVLEDGRAAMDLIAADLRALAPSYGASNVYYVSSVNFYAAAMSNASPPSPLIQLLVGSNPVTTRTNVVDAFFILSRGNQNGVPMWFGVGYAMTNRGPGGAFYSLYRFSTSHPVAAVNPAVLFTNDFVSFLTNVTAGSHLMDGVVHLTVRPYGPDGSPMTANVETNYYGVQTNVVVNRNVLFLPPVWGQTGFFMFSNAVPAAVEVEMGVLEDRTLMRAQSILNPAAQISYLTNAAGQVHVFRQRVAIPNFDPSAYP